MILADSVVLINSYSSLLARVLSIYDGRFNPFRAAALSTWRRSSLLFSVFKFFVGIYCRQSGSGAQAAITLDESRIVLLRQLSVSVSSISQSSPYEKNDILLVITMFGLSSSWYDLADVGIEHYKAARTLLRGAHDVLGHNRRFFEEFLVYWWMMLSFAWSSVPGYSPETPSLTSWYPLLPRVPHPLTGVSPESQLLLGMAGGLVIEERKLLIAYSTETDRPTPHSPSTNTKKVKELEFQLLHMKIPPVSMVLDPGDPHTPVQDLLNIAEAYRTCGLILLYRCYPTLGRDFLPPRAANNVETPERQRQSYISSLANKALDLLESNSDNSGTRTIEAILLVILAGEFARPRDLSSPASRRLPGHPVSQQRSSSFSGKPYPPMTGQQVQQVQQARARVLTRFDRIQKILPFQTISRMKSLVLETWSLTDSGTDVFWVDLLIRNRWSFLMI
jgi:hypothetical protein